MKLTTTVAVFALCWSATALSAEESVNLDEVEAPAPAPQAKGHPHGASSAHSGPRIMGRVDLSAEYSPGAADSGVQKLRANHFLMFLKAEASSQVSFMGEMLRQEFYHITYKPTALVALKFGKILVPFGNMDQYHRYYGGVQGYGASGVMFPIIWAEYGLDAEWKLGPVLIDTYAVNSISSQNGTTNPDFTRDSDGKRQALGIRASSELLTRTKLMLSGYKGTWSPDRPLYLVGADFSTDYGLVAAPVIRNFRLMAGVAVGFVREANPGSYRKYGDYVQLSTNALSFAELRARYGTYVDHSGIESNANTQALSLGAYLPVDVMNLLVEYQFNYEQVNEKKNDLLRLMLALDF